MNHTNSESSDERERERVVTVSKHGQATIPKEFRDELGIDAPGRVKFVRTEAGTVVIESIRSLTDLRGVLADRTDDEGRTATKLLRDERERDERADRETLDRLGIDTDRTDCE